MGGCISTTTKSTTGSADQAASLLDLSPAASEPDL